MTLQTQLTIYCLIIVLMSTLGGQLPSLVRMSHLRTQLLISFVGGLMLGIAFLHLFPHAIANLGSPSTAGVACLIGVIAMFLVLRAFNAPHTHGFVDATPLRLAGDSEIVQPCCGALEVSEDLDDVFEPTVRQKTLDSAGELEQASTAAEAKLAAGTSVKGLPAVSELIRDGLESGQGIVETPQLPHPINESQDDDERLGIGTDGLIESAEGIVTGNDREGSGRSGVQNRDSVIESRVNETGIDLRRRRTDQHHAHCDHSQHQPTEGTARRRWYGWVGILFGLWLHTLIDGVALAASTLADAQHAGVVLAGLGTFLAVALHKPLDAFTITSTMKSGGWSPFHQAIVNVVFAMACPIGALIFYFGVNQQTGNSVLLGWGLAVSSGFFICIALADLLPEVSFHQHDRGKLSLALFLGIALAVAVENLPGHSHVHAQQAVSIEQANTAGQPFVVGSSD